VADQEIPPITKNLKWQPPLEGTIKVNWDASINGKKSCIGLGMVAQDCKGDVLAAKCVRKNIFVDPKTAEAMAALWAVLFCKECGFLDVIFEGDASQVVNEIHSKPPFLSTTSHLIESISQEILSFMSIENAMGLLICWRRRRLFMKRKCAGLRILHIFWILLFLGNVFSP
jgi:hypothetical protein